MPKTTYIPTKSAIGLGNVDNTSDATKNAATATLSGKTLTEPKFVDLGFIADANGNELIVMDTVASAVPYIKVANAATGGVVEIKADGETNQHIAIIGKGNGLTKCSVLRQDDTTNSYKHNTVMLTGWGWKLGTASTTMEETVTFGITFAAAPVVMAEVIGAKLTTDPTTIDENTTATTATTSGTTLNPYTITTTTFKAAFSKYSVDGAASGNFAGTARYMYSWIAVGEL